MKKTLSIVWALALFVLISFSVSAQDKKPAWPQMSAYHQVMSTTFHPAEEGNLKPIKERSGELATKADEWRKSTPPKEFAKEGLKEKLEMLYTESKALDKMVKSGAKDADITKSLTALHDRFHEIVGMCTGEDHNHHGHDHGHEGHKH